MKNTPDYYAMTDAAIAELLGGRLEQLRLEANIPQKQMAAELGISEGTYRNTVKGKARLEVVIGILRILGRLEAVDNFLPPAPYSPMALLEMEGRKRQRARPKAGKEAARAEEEPEW